MRQVPPCYLRHIPLAAFHRFYVKIGVFQMDMPKFLVFIPYQCTPLCRRCKKFIPGRHTANKKNCPKGGNKKKKFTPLAPVNKNFKNIDDMLKYALYDYIPQRYLRRASFEQIDLDRRIIDFKDGRRYATAWAAKAIGRTLSAMDLSDTVIVCIPASCELTNRRRYKRFSTALCQMCGAINGYDYVQVFGKREKVHVTHSHEVAESTDNVHIDDNFFRGRKVLVIDDICTTCRTADNFIERLQIAGADVRMALFLAKTKQMKRRTPKYN